LCTAQLKVNLKPVWSPAAGAISSLADRFGDTVWQLLFHEIKQLRPGSVGSSHSISTEEHQGLDNQAQLDDIWEEERSWRDPSAHQIREVVAKVIDDKAAQVELLRVCFSFLPYKTFNINYL
jgi:U3 small nucleolar RNA-associated protein 20